MIPFYGTRSERGINFPSFCLQEPLRDAKICGVSQIVRSSFPGPNSGGRISKLFRWRSTRNRCGKFFGGTVFAASVARGRVKRRSCLRPLRGKTSWGWKKPNPRQQKLRKSIFIEKLHRSWLLCRAPVWNLSSGAEACNSTPRSRRGGTGQGESRGGGRTRGKEEHFYRAEKANAIHPRQNVVQITGNEGKCKSTYFFSSLFFAGSIFSEPSTPPTVPGPATMAMSRWKKKEGGENENKKKFRRVSSKRYLPSTYFRDIRNCHFLKRILFIVEHSGAQQREKNKITRTQFWGQKGAAFGDEILYHRNSELFEGGIRPTFGGMPQK